MVAFKRDGSSVESLLAYLLAYLLALCSLRVVRCIAPLQEVTFRGNGLDAYREFVYPRFLLRPAVRLASRHQKHVPLQTFPRPYLGA